MERDITEKELEKFTDVAADIVNGLCFSGRQEVQPEDIQIRSEAVAVKEPSGRYHSRTRDVLYEIKKLGICVAYIGIENQSDVDNTMPLRVMGMDYGAYMRQIRDYQAENRRRGTTAYAKRIHDYQKLTPVISLVLNFGKPWEGPRCLLDMLDREKRQVFSEYIADYPVNLIDLSGEPELYKKFHSDFRLLVQYLHAKGNPEEMKKLSQNTQKILHPREFLDLMHALGCDDRYINVKEEIEKTGKEEVAMCELLDYVENRGVERGRAEGREEGRAEGRTEGMKLGREEGIRLGEVRGIISTAYSFGASQEMIIERLCRELEISPLKAEEYMESYVQ